MVDDLWLRTRISPDPQYANPAAIANARREWAQTRENPLNYRPVYGQNPYHLVWKEYKRPDPRVHGLPPLSTPVPEMQEMDIDCNELTCLDEIGGDSESHFDSHVYKVVYRNQICLLKVYRDSRAKDDYYTQGGLDGYSRFRNEKRAYEHLLHFGVCAAAYVPDCYGWFKLRVDPSVEWLRPFASETNPPYAILLQYFPKAEQLNVSNITPKVAQSALLALTHVHNAGVLHCDINPRNHLVLRDGKVVIIDFDVALTYPHPRVNKLDMKWESESAWNMYFQVMLTDNLIGLDSSQTPY